MIVFAYLWLFFLVITTLFVIVSVFVEKNFEESHPVKKWWRRNMIGPDPEDIKYKKTEDDIQQ